MARAQGEADPRRSGGSWLPGPLLRLGHLGALWAFAFVQPLLDLLGRNAEFFVARGNGRADILIFSLGFTLVPPLLMWALVALIARLSRPVAAAIYLLMVCVLAGVIVLGLLNESEIATGVQIALALSVGGLAALAYRSAGSFRSLLSVLIPAPAVFLAFFLFFSDVSDLVGPAPDIEGLEASGERDAPVLVIVFDEFPVASLMTTSGKIDARRFPNFGRLAKTSTWYREATALADMTEQALPAILTGLEPDADRNPTSGDYPRNLFTLFAGSYPLNVWESATRLCPPSLCEEAGRDPLGTRLRALSSDLSLVSKHLLLPESVTADLPPIDQAFFGFETAIETRRTRGPDEERLDSLLEGFRRTESDPSMNFIHFDVPHVPWHILPDGRRCPTDTWAALNWTDSEGVWIEDDEVVRQGLGIHLLQAAYADKLLGRVIDGLERQGVWDEAAVVVVSDHGAAFVPGEPRRILDTSNAGANLRVPFFVKEPGQRRGRISGRQVRAVDVVPTIAELVGLDLPFEVDGVAADKVEPTEEVSAYSESGGGEQTFKRSQLEAARSRLTELKKEILGAKGPLRRIFQLGPRPDLIGAEAGGLSVGEGDGSFSLVAPDAYADVDPRRDSPCQVVAELTGIQEGAPLAVSVNGRIAATSHAYTSATGARQSFATIDPRHFRRGDNEVEVWQIAGGPKRPRLTPIAAAD